MENSEEINDLKAVVNNLTVQLGVLSAQCQVLRSCFMEVIPGMLPKEHEQNLYTNLVDEMEKRVIKSLDDVQPILFDTADSAFLLRQKFEANEAFQAMKRDDRYIKSNGTDEKNAQ